MSSSLEVLAWPGERDLTRLFFFCCSTPGAWLRSFAGPVERRTPFWFPGWWAPVPRFRFPRCTTLPRSLLLRDPVVLQGEQLSGLRVIVFHPGGLILSGQLSRCSPLYPGKDRACQEPAVGNPGLITSLPVSQPVPCFQGGFGH